MSGGTSTNAYSVPLHVQRSTGTVAVDQLFKAQSGGAYVGQPPSSPVQLPKSGGQKSSSSNHHGVQLGVDMPKPKIRSKEHDSPGALVLRFVAGCLSLLFPLLVLGVSLGSGQSYLACAFATGATIAAMSMLLSEIGNVSGNPIITLAMIIYDDNTSALAGFVEVLGQVLASFAAALLLLLILGDAVIPRTPTAIDASLTMNAFDRTATVVNPDAVGLAPHGNVNVGQAFIVETVGVWVLAWVAIKLLQISHNSSPKGMNPISRGFVDFFTYTGLFIMAFPYTGASFNLFRSLGIAVISGYWQPYVSASWWIYAVAPLAGFVLAVITDFLLKIGVDYKMSEKRNE